MLVRDAEAGIQFERAALHGRLRIQSDARVAVERAKPDLARIVAHRRTEIHQQRVPGVIQQLRTLLAIQPSGQPRVAGAEQK